MRCSRCGLETTAGNERCTACGHMPTVAPTMATGVLTPLPPSSQSFSDLDVTRLPDSPTAAFSPHAETVGFDGDTTGMPPLDGDRTHPGPAGRHPRPVAAMLTDGQLFGTRYRIIGLLGMGGMGAVYQAWDAELDVVVALKVIRPEATSDPEETRAIERRFKQELLLARQVTHKNVVRIHDLGEIDGIKYITMSYIDGEDLSTVLKREGKLPVPEALRILRQVASGLMAAHDAGVVHRDLKPANIMIEGGNAVIMDFGIARSSSSVPAVPPGASGIWRPNRLPQATQAGAIVGTIAYMAPEQAKGESVDQRADIYALGLIMSDMLLGRRDNERTTLEELRRRSVELPRTLRSMDPDIPEALDQIVVRCLQPNPDARFGTTSELVAALDRLDKNGAPLPLVRRLTGRMMAATAVVAIALLIGTAYLTRRAVALPEQHDPVSVVIADFENRTNDPAFDRTIEPMLRRALESAGFITAYDRTGVNALGVRPPESLSEAAARELAVKQGLGVVLSGSIEPSRNGYALAVKAVQTVTGNILATAEGRASSKEEVVEAATRLAARVRTALGDDTSDEAQMFAMASLSATSLDVLRHYSAGREASSLGKFDEARRSYANAVNLDPKFGIGYQALATLSMNLGNQQDADRYFKQALQYLDSMTERERYTTRGMYYRTTGDYAQCVKEYTDLIARFAADVLAHNNLALCSTFLRDMPTALAEMQRAVKILPNRALFRINLALYGSYAGDFQIGEQEARAAQDLGSPLALVPLAFAQLGQGQLSQVAQTYQALEKIDSLGPMAVSHAAAGFGDLAVLEGRFSDAARILQQGAANDLASKSADRAAAKLAYLAYVELLRGQPRAAVAAADQAVSNSKAVKIRFLAARSFVEAGEIDRARSIVMGLASELQAEPQAYAKIVEGRIALKNGDPRQAIKILTEANALLDTWIAHFDLGQAYFEADAIPQADAEFDRCLKRRGEALALFLDEEPTYGYFPPVYYYQGRVREALKNAGFAESYREYLTLRGQSKEDSLLADVRRRAGGAS
jgi:eukaryotic-like serine/threonine-protein kinase